MKAVIVYNPKATGFNKEVLNRAYANFRKQGMSVQTSKSTHQGQLPELVKKANKENDIIVTLGGDGTLGEAFEAFNEVDQNARYIHIPTGTSNDTADNLSLHKGYPIESLNLYSNIKECREEDVDIVTANGVPFGYVSCTGTFTDFTYNTPSILKQVLGKLGYYTFAGVSGITKIPEMLNPSLRLKYQVDSKNKITNALTFFVSNSKTFGGFKLFKDAKITDGLFEVTIIKKLPKKELLEILHELFLNDCKNLDISKYSEYIDSFTTDNFKVTMLKGKSEVDFNHDGDKKIIPLKKDRTIEYKTTKKVKMLLPNKESI